MELTPQQQQAILGQLNRPGWKVTGQRPETQKVSGRDENNNPTTVDQPTGNVVLVITGPGGQSDEVTVKPPESYPGPYAPNVNDPGPYNPDPNPTIVKGPQNNPQAPAAAPGWTDVSPIRNADGTSTYYGRDPADGQFKKVPGLPTESAPASTAKTPTPTSQLETVKAPDGTPIAYRDPATGQTIELPKTTPDKPQIIQGPRGQIYKWDGTSLTTVQQGDPAAPTPTEGQTRQSVIPGTQYVGQEIYHNGVWSLDPNFTPKQYVPTDKPKEGDIRPNVVSGQSVQEVYRGGSWVVDTSVPPKPFVPQPPTNLSAPAGQQYIVQQDPQTGKITQTANPNYQAADIGGRITQLQQQASAKRDELNQKVAAGQMTQDQATTEFNSYWDTSIAPTASQLQQVQAQQAQDQAIKANAEQRAQQEQTRADFTTAQSAGQNAVSNVMQILPNMHSQKFLAQYSAALNGLANSTPGSVNFTPDAFSVPMPDLNAIAQDATAKALAHLSPTAASIAGQPLPTIPPMDVSGMLNKSTYAPTTTISPDGTVTIQHSPQPQSAPATPAPFAQSGMAEGSNGSVSLPAPGNPVDPSQFLGAGGDPWLNSTYAYQGGAIPAMASGGVVNQPTVALIGEAGPEAVVPLGKGDDLAAAEAAANAQSSAVGGYYQGYYQQPAYPAPGDVAGWRSYLQQYVPDNLKGDPEFLNILLAGAHGESGLDAQRVQPNGNGRGLFQFDTGPGAMGEGLSQNQLFDPAYQASRMVPIYAQYYQNAPPGLSGAQKAAWVAAMAERPYDYQNPNSVARNNYQRSYSMVTRSG